MDTGNYYSVFKEPRGFIKVLQILFAIFAFATTSGYSGSFLWNVTCSNNVKTEYKFNISYPFNFKDTNPLKPQSCPPANGSTPQPPDSPNLYYGNFTSSAQFYVFVGVITMLYCLAILVVYIFFNNTYEYDQRVPKADFIVSAVLVLFWFIAAIAWADGVSKLKEYSEPSRIFQELYDCGHGATCANAGSLNYAGLNVSLIFGFTNILLWASGLWFLWKETSWYQGDRSDSFANPSGISADGSHM